MGAQEMTLAEWFAQRDILDQLYQEELGRRCWTDPDAQVNWLYHWRENNSTVEEIRVAIRTSMEWQQKHPGGPVNSPPTSTGWLPRGTRIPVATGRFAKRFYSYWSNAWVTGTVAWVFGGSLDTGGPEFFRVDLTTGSSSPQGPLAMAGYRSETEGWTWDAAGRIYLIQGSRYLHVEPHSGDVRVVYDIAGESWAAGCTLWQPHVSDDGQTASATVKNSAYQKIGTVIFKHSALTFVAAIGDLDESIITPDGTFAVIQDSQNNYFINLETWHEEFRADADRAVAHCDCGPGYVIGEADKPDPGACVIWDLNTMTCRILFPTLNQGHISVRNGTILQSDATNLSLNLIGLDGTVTPIFHHGQDPGGDYDRQVRANLDPSGRIACLQIGDGIDLVVV